MDPALTAEEWREVSFERNECWAASCSNGRRVFLSAGRSDPEALSVRFADAERHGLAALALYGQRFGFTREDVDLLTVAAYVWREATTGPTFDYGARMASLRDRIAALLPPPESPA